MASTAEKERYPLATQEGNSIPLEVAEAIAYTSIAFTGAATSPLTFPSNSEIVALLCDKPCIVSFGSIVPTLVGSVFNLNLAMIPANCVVYLYIPRGKESISVVKDGADNGTLKVQIYRAWRALKQTLGQF
jgi:hypothetical protein